MLSVTQLMQYAVSKLRDLLKNIFSRKEDKMSAITALPDAPSRATPSTFASKADAFIAALPGFVSEVNAIISTIFGRLSGTKTLVNNTVTTLCEISTEAGYEFASGILYYSVEVVTALGNQQVHTGIATFAGINDGFPTSLQIDKVIDPSNETNVCLTGTLSVAVSVSSGDHVLKLKIKATSNLTPTSMIAKYTVFLNGNNAITAS